MWRNLHFRRLFDPEFQSQLQMLKLAKLSLTKQSQNMKSVDQTKEGFQRKKHSCGFILFKTVIYTHILNIFSIN